MITAVGSLDDGAAYDVMMIWHESVSGDPAQRWLREQVRRLFGDERLAANEPALAAARGCLHWINPANGIRVPN